MSRWGCVVLLALLRACGPGGDAWAQTPTTLPFCSAPAGDSCIPLQTLPTTTSTSTTTSTTAPGATTSTSTSSSTSTSTSTTSTTSSSTTTTTVAGGLIWSRSAGGVSSDNFAGIATDASGNVYVAGNFYANATIAGVPFTNFGSLGRDVFLAKYSSTGTPLWAKQFGGTGDDVATGLAIDSTGHPYVVGYFTDPGNFGTGTLTSAGATDIFLGRYNPADGSASWVLHPGGLNYDAGYAIAVDAFDNVVITGGFIGTVDFGAGPVVGVGSQYDWFVAKYTGSSGFCQWSKSFLNGGNELGYAIHTDPSGNVFSAGTFSSKIDFGAGQGIFTSLGSTDIGVVKLNSSGVAQWGRQGGGTSADGVGGIDIDANGNPIVVGYFSAPADFGTGSLTGTGFEGVAVSYAAATGATRWAKSFGGVGADYARAVLVSGTNVYVTGQFSNTATFAPGVTLTSLGSYDIPFLKYVADTGAFTSVQRYASTNADSGSGVVVRGAQLAFGGLYSNTITFPGSATLTSAGGQDVFVVTLTPP